MKKTKNENKTVLTLGVFDLLHAGHIKLFKRAKKFGDRLIIGVQRDHSVFEQKGKTPILNENERASAIKIIPFIDRVEFYSHHDYLKIIEKVKPNIIVQGGDWFNTGDRTNVMEFFKKQGISFKMFPYTKGISTTEIKRRVIDNLYMDNAFNYPLINLFKKLRVLSIKKLSLYEKFDHVKVKKLKKKILKDKVFKDPIIVGEITQNNKNIFIVLDGVNRLEAIKQIGAKKILAYVVPYFNESEVSLLSNKHFLEIDKEELLDLFGDFINKKNKNRFQQVATLTTGNNKYLIESPKDLKSSVMILNKLVGKYKGKINFARLSETDNPYEKIKPMISFSKFFKNDIVELVNNDIMLESGITWHRINYALIRLNIPLDLLKENTSEEVLNNKIKKIIDNKIKNFSIRRYANPVVTFDEW